MALRFDEKGKYYTDYVTKESVPVVIQTTMHHIRGYVYVQEEGRLSDELNGLDHFLPVTQAIVLDLAGNKLYESNFLAVNRNQIVWVYPENMPPPEEANAVDALLMGQDPLAADEIYMVEDSLTMEEVEPDIEESDSADESADSREFLDDDIPLSDHESEERA